MKIHFTYYKPTPYSSEYSTCKVSFERRASFALVRNEKNVQNALLTFLYKIYSDVVDVDTPPVRATIKLFQDLVLTTSDVHLSGLQHIVFGKHNSEFLVASDSEGLLFINLQDPNFRSHRTAGQWRQLYQHVSLKEPLAQADWHRPRGVTARPVDGRLLWGAFNDGFVWTASLESMLLSEQKDMQRTFGRLGFKPAGSDFVVVESEAGNALASSRGERDVRELVYFIDYVSSSVAVADNVDPLNPAKRSRDLTSNTSDPDLYELKTLVHLNLRNKGGPSKLAARKNQLLIAMSCLAHDGSFRGDKDENQTTCRPGTLVLVNGWDLEKPFPGHEDPRDEL